MRTTVRLMTLLCLVLGMTGVSSVQASHINRAISYINPDTGAVTENPNVNRNSDCGSPDQSDRQQLSDAGMTNRNVHNDACLRKNGEDVDEQVTFVSRGTGYISACPDPDDATLTGGTNGPKTASTEDRDGDGFADVCHQSGYQSKNADGDDEYHIRLNNFSEVGRQRVVFCYDEDQNNCGDETIKDVVSINWVRAPVRAVSYINPDLGMPTANPNVDRNSECASPDRRDPRQKLSDEGMTNKNVHNDACLFFGKGSRTNFDGPVTFESRGTGYISACPDPDDATLTGGTNGPKTASTEDRDGDGFADVCHQSGYQLKLADGDFEYHARMNNFSDPGEQRVVFCYDRDQDGCSDESLKDRIEINWVS